jgi:hypothetical protein
MLPHQPELVVPIDIETRKPRQKLARIEGVCYKSDQHLSGVVSRLEMRMRKLPIDREEVTFPKLKRVLNLFTVRPARMGTENLIESGNGA